MILKLALLSGAGFLAPLLTLFFFAARGGLSVTFARLGLALSVVSWLIFLWLLKRWFADPFTYLVKRAQETFPSSKRPTTIGRSRTEIDHILYTLEQMQIDLTRFADIPVADLLSEKNKTEQIINSSEDGIILTSKEGLLQLINPKARTILELREENDQALQTRPLWSFIPHDRLSAAVREAIQNKDGVKGKEIDLSQETQRCFYTLSVSQTRSPSANEGDVWMVLMLRNITAEKELEQLKDDFIQSLTHDLRSPLTALRGYLEVLRDEMAGPLNDEQKKIIRIMENANVKLLHIVSNLLDTAKISAGKLKMNLLDCDIRKLVPQVVELFHTEAKKKNITLTVDLPEEMNTIRLDTSMMERILANLIGNAIKFTPEKGFITVKFSELSDRVQGEVTDTGAGMPPEFMQKIFKKFEQVRGTRGGTGLGLSICKYMVDAHFGEIQARSKVGAGTSFIFTIPKNLDQNDKGEVFLLRPSISPASHS